jgi:putative membrane protein
MKVRTKDFFTGEEKRKIRQAVEAAEKNTSGEIVVALVDESDAYREAELLGGLLLSALISLIVAIVLRHSTIWFFIPVTVILFFPCLYLLKAYPHVKLALTGRKRVEQAVAEEAVYTFFKRGVHKTAEETGILIFISLLERKVWILADRGIDSKIEPKFWKSLANELTQGIRDNQPFEALNGVIEKCAAELGRHFPGGSDKKNQLCDEIICA